MGYDKDRLLELQNEATGLKEDETIEQIAERLVQEIEYRIQRLRDLKLRIQYAATPREGDKRSRP